MYYYSHCLSALSAYSIKNYLKPAQSCNHFQCDPTHMAPTRVRKTRTCRPQPQSNRRSSPPNRLSATWLLQKVREKIWNFNTRGFPRRFDIAEVPWRNSALTWHHTCLCQSGDMGARILVGLSSRKQRHFCLKTPTDHEHPGSRSCFAFPLLGARLA